MAFDDEAWKEELGMGIPFKDKSNLDMVVPGGKQKDKKWTGRGSGPKIKGQSLEGAMKQLTGGMISKIENFLTF
jgi:hypothetical protein